LNGETIDNTVDGVISLTGIASTTSIRLANLETIVNSTDGTITLANDGGATISFTPATGTITPSTGTINVNGIMSAATTTATTALVIPVGASPSVTDSCADRAAGALFYDTNGDSGAKLLICNGTNWTKVAD